MLYYYRGDNMIKDENTRISVTISKENRDKLKRVAKNEHRSMSKMVEHLISTYIESSESNANDHKH
ncbi:ribbon-helix-helix domain-containing protein [Staphylococcus chromogenes]|uniref:ribbon-helix-helix domain-containing protein n=2 Tax=Staphylococcus chromogenes TaxID=46126 RepID=UPI0035CEC58A